MAPDERPAVRPDTSLARRALTVAAVVEPLSLLVLVTNVATVHLPAIAAATGPVHGTAYLLGIGATWAGGCSVRARVLAWVPGIGAALAARDAGGLPRTRTPAHDAPT